MYNYADDNTLSFIHRQLAVLKSVVESENGTGQQSNASKTFQAIATGSRTHSEFKSFNVAGNTLAFEKTVKLFGVELDYQLDFNKKVSRICQKVAKQLNV